jgi:hypothetical protein
MSTDCAFRLGVVTLSLLCCGCRPDDRRGLEEGVAAVVDVVGGIIQSEHDRLSAKTCWLLPEWKANPELYASGINLVVRTVNVDGGNSDEYPRPGVRVFGIAQALHDDEEDRIGVTGIVEAHDVSDCPVGTASSNSVACFAEATKRFYGSDVVRAHWLINNESGRGVVVGGPWLLADNKTAWEIGYGRWLLETRVSSYAGRFRFYVTTLSNDGHDDDKSAERVSEIKQIKEHVKARVQPGELPPIVVGDFNFTSNGGANDEPSTRQQMEEDFYLVSKVGSYCYDGIHGAIPYNQVWIGKASRFPSTNGSYKAVRYSTVDTPTGIELHERRTVLGIDFLNGLTDHREAVAISFLINSTGRVDDVAPGVPARPFLTTNGLNQGKVGQPYSAMVSTFGGTTPYTWSIDEGTGALPPGISLGATTATGIFLTGRPTVAGSYSFTVRVRDSGNPSLTDTQVLLLVVNN